MEDSFSSVIKIVIFLIIFVGGIVSDIAKKNKAKKRFEEAERAEEAETQPPIMEESPPPQPRQPRKAGTPPRRPAAPTNKPTAAAKPVKPKILTRDDDEWAATLADQKRREAAKAAAKTAERQGAPESDILGVGVSIDKLQEEQSVSPFATSLRSVQEVRNGIVMAEILGPPVSMRRQ